MTLEKLVEERIRELKEIILKAENYKKQQTEGRLRTSIGCNGKSIYYLVDDKCKSTGGTYIKKENIEIAMKLAQKEYGNKIYTISNLQLKHLERLLIILKEQPLSDVYTKLSQGRKELVAPIVISDEEYATDWLNEEYVPKKFGENTVEIYSEKGERVRSKSEKIIADKLYAMGIPYKYEHSIYLDGLGTVYPDFTVLNKRTRKIKYWEHMGMMDDSDYSEKALNKILSYERNGIFPGEELILTHETMSNPLDTRLLEKIIKKYLQ